MSNSFRHMTTAMMAALFLIGGNSVYAETQSTSKDLNDFLCKEVMRLSGSERENALALLHGYRLGKKNTTQYQIETLAAFTDSYIDHCLDNPDDNALVAFEKIA